MGNQGFRIKGLNLNIRGSDTKLLMKFARA